jgi:hypothetical protein
LIEDAYTLGRSLGLEGWCEDEAGPFQTAPVPGPSWQRAGQPSRYPHEYVRDGTAKVLTLFHPASGQVRVKGVTSTTNDILHGWIKQELGTIVAALPEPTAPLDDRAREAWRRWQLGLKQPISLPASLPPLRVLLLSVA